MRRRRAAAVAAVAIDTPKGETHGCWDASSEVSAAAVATPVPAAAAREVLSAHQAASPGKSRALSEGSAWPLNVRVAVEQPAKVA
jgi:hypothetical protein